MPELKAVVQRRPRDYHSAQRVVLSLALAKRLDGAVLISFCNDGRYEEAVVALATLVRVPVKITEQLISGGQPDPILILCKAAGLTWPAVKALIQLRPDGAAIPAPELDTAFTNFDRLSASTAQRVVRFWQARDTA
jgi:hypothetical protein